MPYHYHNRVKSFDKVLEKLKSSMHTPVAELSVTAWHSEEPLSFSDRQTGKKLQLEPGDKWGELFDCAWFHFTGTVPEEAEGKAIDLLLDVSGEMLIVDADGKALTGMTAVSGWSEDNLVTFPKKVFHLARRAKAGQKIDLWADAGCNNLFGRLFRNGVFERASIAVPNPQIRALYYDFEVLNELRKQLCKDGARCQQIVHALSEATLELSEYTDENAERARKILAVELAKKGGDPSMTISAVGHAHLDLAWLWPIRETIRKGARTFSTALDLMKRYPDYVFGASQPQLYQWIKEDYPDIYRQIKRRVREGRWELQGASWVEMDANVPSGESLVRQLLYGKRFFREEFGIDVENLWLPDVFGYSAAMPQILKKCQVDYFMTQKLSWNDTNTHPHHTFVWEGIDGSEMLVHMLPEDTYNSDVTSASIARAERNYLDKAVSDRCLTLFGIGDGGGGPGAEHLERLNRIKNLDGLARVKQEPAFELFKNIAAGSAKYKKWRGELYLEKHRGTYTTQARNKRYNRKLELELRSLEFFVAVNNALGGSDYPGDEIETIWKEVLLYQFHDILPGSSIKRVYDESLERYAKLSEQTEAMTRAAIGEMVKQIDTSKFARPAVVVNALSFERNEWLKVADGWKNICVPSMGYCTVEAGEETKEVPAVTASNRRLANDRLDVTFEADGSIGSIVDKRTGREIVGREETANRLAVYVDQPQQWDAWDIEVDYPQQVSGAFKLQSSAGRVDGPKAIVEQNYVYNDSRLRQEIILTAGSARLDFVTKVEWNETQKMLRTSFPLAVKSETATCEIQFGSVKRPTHTNTSWEAAKFEVCAHKWVDISQPDYGVAMLNDCKYGCRVLDNVLDLNLLRSPVWPDPQADRTEHVFTYSLLPHEGDHRRGNVVQEAYSLNVPLQIATPRPSAGSLASSHSFMSVDSSDVVIETVKKAEASDDMIVRLYECHGSSTAVSLVVEGEISKAEVVDMIEENAQPVDLTDNCIKLTFSPFEVKTLKVRLKK